MGKDSRRSAKKESRRRRRIDSAFARDDLAPAPTSILDLPDDLLELILLCLSTPVCLFHAAATCKALRHIVAGAGFLLRFRTLHGQRLLLGHYCVNADKIEDGVTQLNTEFIPLPPWPTNNHLRQRLSVDFVPRHRRVLTDSRGGLLAFIRDNWYTIVCDPWTRQYRELRFPWGQYDCCSRETRDRDYHCIGAFLLDADDGGNGDGSPMSSFMVLCACLVRNTYHDTVTAQACVFSARENCWLRWSRSMDDIGSVHWTGDWDKCTRFMGRAGGSIFWFGHDGYVLAFDENTGEFSTFRMPVPPIVNIYITAGQEYYRQNVQVVGGGGTSGAVRVVRVVGGALKVLVLNRAHHGAWECTEERGVGLCHLANIEARPHQSWRFVDTDMVMPPAMLALGAFSPSSNLFFSLDIETLKLQRLDHRMILSAAQVFPFEIPWPHTISTFL